MKLIIERLKMANINREVKQLKEKSSLNKSSSFLLADEDESYDESNTDDFSTPIKPKASKKVLVENSAKRHRAHSSDSSDYSPEQQSASSSNSFCSPANQYVLAQLKNKNNSDKKTPTPNVVASNSSSSTSKNTLNTKTTTSAPTIVLPQNFMQLFSQPASLFNSGILQQGCPSSDCASFIRASKQLPSHQPALGLPANFSGTILFQPTIHIHCSSSSALARNNSSVKYRPIVSKNNLKCVENKESKNAKSSN